MQLWHYKAKLVRIIDADTIVAKLDLGFHVTKQHTFRLDRINAPEPRGEEKEKGLAATEYLKSLISDGDEFIIHSVEMGSFGRYIAEIYLQDGDDYLNVNDHLVKVGHAEYKEY